MRAARLIVDGPQSGPLNMAVDQALLESAADGGTLTLRFYEWSEPTLSLGYFQPLASRSEHAPSNASALVRRASGGGAILHDRELTYSLAIPPGMLALPGSDPRDARALYRAVHESLLATLAEVGLAARLCDGAAAGAGPEQAFLCFERRAVGDVLLGNAKIGGSAQRRFRDAVLQHGSVLLAQSAVAPELPGIRELSGVSLKPADLVRRWLPRLAERLAIRYEPGELSASERARAAELVAQRYGAGEWTALK